MRKLLSTLGLFLFLSATNAFASEGTPFRAIGKLMEVSDTHTNRHGHELQFLRLSDGKTFDVVDSPQLEKLHCESGKNPVVEVDGYQTDRFLFWGGNLVVKNFTIHDDIQVAEFPHKAEIRTGSRRNSRM